MIRKRAMGLELTIRKRDGIRVHYERTSAGVRVDHEKRAMGLELTMRKRGLG